MSVAGYAPSEASRVSVGNTLANPRGLSRQGLGYTNDTTVLVETIQDEARKEMVRKGTANAVLLPHALPVELVEPFAAKYADYNISFLKCYMTSHVVFDAHRHMMLNAMLDKAAKYSDEMIIVGNVLFQAGTRGFDNVHIEQDPSSAHAVHAHHEAGAQFLRAHRSRVDIQVLHGFDMPPYAFNRYKTGAALATCVKGDECRQQADFFGVDCSATFMSPKQAGSAMIECGAKMGRALLPYSPEIFCEKSGELGGACGVFYEWTGKTVVMKYIDGTQGCPVLPANEYFEWLTLSYVCVPDSKNEPVWFHMEIVEFCEPFAVIDLVRVDGDPGDVTVTHALDMPWAEGKYVVQYQRLRSPHADPARPTSWEDASSLVSCNVVDKVYEYALSLPQTQFTVDKVLDRTMRMNGRVIVAGMNVRLHQPLPVEASRVVARQVYARAFVERYEMGRLGSHLTGQLAKVRKFSIASRLEKLGAVLFTIFSTEEGMLANAWEGIHTMLDKWHAWVSGVRRLKKPQFSPVAKFLLMDDYVAGRSTVMGTLLRKFPGGGVTTAGVKGAVRAAINFGGPYSGKSVLDLDVSVQSEASGRLYEGIVGMSVVGGPGVSDVAREVTAEVMSANFTSRGVEDRFAVDVAELRPDYGLDTPLDRLTSDVDLEEVTVQEVNEVMEQVFPGLAEQDFELDLASMAYDPQHRDIEASYAVLPADGERLRSQAVYKSKFTGYNVEKKVQTVGDTLTAIQSRTLSAPQLRSMMNEDQWAHKTWATMMETYFRPEAHEMVEGYQRDRVRLEAEVYAEWATKARPENLKKVMTQAVKGLAALEEAQPWVYDIMLKSDAKPPLSTKPLYEVVAPQLIVMNEKAVSSLFSSVIRVMSRRFVSLLKPNIMVNLLKDADAIADHIAACHTWDEVLVYLENDFSKFDKSQDRFTFVVMRLVFDKLGFDEDMLNRWVDANDRCVLKSMALGILIVTAWGNKSGGPATAFQNVVMNMGSVAVAYAGSDIVWATFMGDDSLVACRRYVSDGGALEKLAQVYNFEAKFFILRHPYFVSCFVVFDKEARRVYLVPDPIKRLQKWSVSVSALNPRWVDKARSAHETLAFYHRRSNWELVCPGVRERYNVDFSVRVGTLVAAVGWFSFGQGVEKWDDECEVAEEGSVMRRGKVCGSTNFRSMYDAAETVLNY